MYTTRLLIIDLRGYDYRGQGKVFKENIVPNGGDSPGIGYHTG
jgi:hypothetical protein